MVTWVAAKKVTAKVIVLMVNLIASLLVGKFQGSCAQPCEGSEAAVISGEWHGTMDGLEKACANDLSKIINYK